ncbi:MAG: hypothetical protein DRR19_23300 [Candidatus Parabeggiatoa sp. nov. 1]|nr:MAG: hypothetical protein DRR19_23300 [Gammaproteobacteria bacterium]
MRRTWTSEEEQILRRYYRREKAIGIHKRISYRSMTCIRSKAYSMGLYFRQQKFPRKYWTTRELSILDRFYPIEGFACGKRLFRRTKPSIFAMARRRELEHPQPWLLEEDAILSAYYPSEGINCKKRLPNRGRNAIQARAKLLAKGGFPWSEEETDIIKNNPEFTAKALQEFLPNRTWLSIVKKKRQLEMDGEIVVLNKKQHWISEEVAILRHYYPTEGTACQKRLPSRTKIAIREHARRLRLETPSIEWSRQEKDILRNNSQLTLKELQKLLPGRSLDGIAGQKGKLKLTKKRALPNPLYWSDEEDAILQHDYPIEGSSCQTRLPNRTTEAIRSRAKLLGLTETVVEWSEEENELLREHSDLPMKALQEFLPRRTPSAIRNRQKRLQAQGELTIYLKVQYWSDEEDAILEHYYPIEGSNCQERLPHRSRNAIQARAKILDFTSEPALKWTEEELDILKENCTLESKALQQFLPGRSADTIAAKRRQLETSGEITTPRRKQSWFPEEDAILQRYYPTEGMDCEKRLPNRSRYSVDMRARRLGIVRQK